MKETENASVIKSPLIVEGEKLKRFLDQEESGYNPYDGPYGGKADTFIRAWVRIHNDMFDIVKIVEIKGKWANPKNWEPKFESEEGVVY